jgi:DNA-binding FadR family transcriptional regulator
MPDDVPAGSAPSVSGAATWERSLWRPIRDGNAFESTVQRLAQVIKLGVVPLGERLPAERGLADRLQVSRVTVREAIRALRDAGFVETRRGRSGGTFVVYTPDGGSLLGAPDDFVPENTGTDDDRRAALTDVLALRVVLEPGVAALAATRALPASDRAHLVTCLEVSRERDPSVRRVNDSRLHVAIAAATGSPSLTSAVADVQLRLDGYLAGIPVLERNLEHSDSQHAAVVEAILAGDGEKARLAMEEHCEATGLLLEGLLT